MKGNNILVDKSFEVKEGSRPTFFQQFKMGAMNFSNQFFNPLLHQGQFIQDLKDNWRTNEIGFMICVGFFATVSW